MLGDSTSSSSARESEAEGAVAAAGPNKARMFSIILSPDIFLALDRTKTSNRYTVHSHCLLCSMLPVNRLTSSISTALLVSELFSSTVRITLHSMKQ